MKTNNEEKHNRTNDAPSGNKNDSSNKNNQEKRVIHSSRRDHSEQDSERDRKRRPRVGDRSFSADNRPRHSAPNREYSSDRNVRQERYASPDRSKRSEQSESYPSSDRYPTSDRGNRYQSDNRGNRYASDNRGNQQPGYTPRDKGGYNRTVGPKKVIKPLKKKKPFKQVKYKENADPNSPIRLNKYLANAGVCSRREADEFIQAGVVKVNGEVITELGTKIVRSDNVTFHDKPIQLESKVYVLLNKPKGFVTTTDDPENRKTVMDLVRSACSERIYPVGRLDRGTTGVLLLTNDGDLASKLTHPRYEKRKIYQVWVDKPVAIEHMQAIADGVELEDGEIHVDAISYVTEDDLTQIGVEIHSGKNRVVRRIFEKFDYRVLRLDRVYFAGLTKKNLSRGRWRYLTEKEVNMLRMGAFE